MCGIPHAVVTQGADCTTTGDKASYTVPTGFRAELMDAGADETGGAATVVLQWTPSGGSAIGLQTATADDLTVYSGQRLALGEGDKIAWNCTVSGTSGAWDLWLSLKVYKA